MLSLNECKNALKRYNSDLKIGKSVKYKNYYIIVGIGSDPEEGSMDAFYSVDRNTGKVSEFPIMNHIELLSEFK